MKHRSTSFIALGAALFTMYACGGVEASTSLSGYVDEAMADLPYQYKMLPQWKNDDYVVFEMINGKKNVAINVAFGLPSKTDTCSKPPRLPAKHKKGFHPFFGAAGAPLICVADDHWRPSDSRESSAIRGRMASLVPPALCNAVYDKEEFEDFVCFD